MATNGKSFKGGTLRENLLAYSQDRIKRDRDYRRDFVAMQKAKRDRRKEQGGAK